MDISKEEGEVTDSNCAKCRETDKISENYDVDFSITFYDSEFSNHIYHQIDKFIHSECMKLKAKKLENLSKRRSSNHVTKLFSNVDLSMEINNTFPPGESSFLDLDCSQVVETDFNSCLELEDKKESKNIINESQSKCFNCDASDHLIFQCPFERNPAKISANKQQFSSFNVKEPLENNFTPGIISKDLENALGIGPNQLPLHIYKMRKFGYPPGWLEEAKSINISFSDKQNNAQSPSYDEHKIHIFPGFNAETPKNKNDEFQTFGFLPLNPKDLKENFIKNINITNPVENNVTKNIVAIEPTPCNNESLKVPTANENSSETKGSCELKFDINKVPDFTAFSKDIGSYEFLEVSHERKDTFKILKNIIAQKRS